MYVALSDGRLLSLSCDLVAMALTRDDIALYDIFGDVRDSDGSESSRECDTSETRV